MGKLNNRRRASINRKKVKRIVSKKTSEEAKATASIIEPAKTKRAVESPVKVKQHKATPEELALKRQEAFGNDVDNAQQLPLIAQEINGRFSRTKLDIYSIGELLTRAKNMLPHGEFQDWVKKNFDFSYQTANNFMNVYIGCGGNAEIVQRIKPSVLYKITSNKFPEDLRKYLVDNAEILDEIDNETIEDIGKKFANGDIDLDSPEIKELLKYNDEEDEKKLYNFEIEKRIEAIAKTQTMLEKLANKIDWPVLNDEDKPVLTKKQKKNVRELIDKMSSTVMSLTPAL